MNDLVRARAAEAILAAAVAGGVEGCRVVLAAGGAPGAGRTLAVWIVVSGLACAPAIIAAAIGLVVIAATSRTRVAQAWLRDLSDGGVTRTRAVWRAGLAACVIATFGAGSYVISAWAHEVYRFRDADAVAFLITGALTVGTVGLGFAAIEIDRVACRRLVTASWAKTAFAGRRMSWATLSGAALVAIAPVAALEAAAPALGLAAVLPLSILAAVIALFRTARIGRARAAQIAAAAVLATCIAAVGASRAVDQARGMAVNNGWLSRSVLRALWFAADRDGDGYAGSLLGGADCDDDDPQPPA
jgi:hypothetical protein